MANRWFKRDGQSTEPKLTKLYAKITIGASGAPTLVAASSKAIKSITRNGAGDYTLVLSDTYQKFLFMKPLFQKSDGLPAAPDVALKGAPTPGAAGGASIGFVCSSAGSATDPSNGATLYLEITMGDSGAI